MARDVNIRVRVDDREIRELRAAVARLRAQIGATGVAGVAGSNLNSAIAGAAGGALASGARSGGTSTTSPSPGFSSIASRTSVFDRLSLNADPVAAAYMRDSWTEQDAVLQEWVRDQDRKYGKYHRTKGMFSEEGAFRSRLVANLDHMSRITREGRTARDLRNARMTSPDLNPMDRRIPWTGNFGVGPSRNTVLRDSVTGQRFEQPTSFWDDLPSDSTRTGRPSRFRSLTSRMGSMTATLFGMRGPSNAASRFGVVNPVIPSGGKLESFFSKPKLSGFNPLKLDKLKEKFDQIGGIASVGALVAFAKKTSEERTNYVNKIMQSDGIDIPSSGPIQNMYDASLSKAVDLLGDGVYVSMFDIPAAVMSLGAGAAALGPYLSDQGHAQFELAMEMTGASFKETLGMNLEGYKQVTSLQKEWRAGLDKIVEQRRRQAEQQAEGWAQRLQSDGLSHIPLKELERTVYKGTVKGMVDAARLEYHESVPFPTSRLVNPHGVDGIFDNFNLWDYLRKGAKVNRNTSGR